MLTDYDLAVMGKAQLGYMPDDLTIRKRVKVSDNAGGHTWATVDIPSKGRVMPMATQPIEGLAPGADLATMAAWVITLPAGTAVTADDLIVKGSQVYQVNNVNAGETWLTATRCIATLRS
jgi:hypothetical protein